MPKVYIVHCIDTEGPLFESMKDTFERLEKVFDVNDIKPSKENLKKLQEKQIFLDGKEDAVASFLDKDRLKTNETWDQISTMLQTITSEKFRKRVTDSYGNGWIYNWFCLDHFGFNGNNPKRRDLGIHNIYDYYLNYIEELNGCPDKIYWHYHPLTIIRDADKSGTSYLNSSNITEILSRKIIDRLFFPAAFRPGFHTERPDSNWFLEQWIPFDYANQSVLKSLGDQPDLSGNRFGDWSRAPTRWYPYNPDFYDYQKEGPMKRYVTRCLNMNSRIRQIKITDVEQAFYEARAHGKSLLSFTNHDFRDMQKEVEVISDMIDAVAKKNKDVEFVYCNAVEAMRGALGLTNLAEPNFQIVINKKNTEVEVVVSSQNDIFGPQPFLAIKTKGGVYYWENFDFKSVKGVWSYTFDYSNINYCDIEKIGVAANTLCGITEIQVLDTSSGKIMKNILNK